MASPLMKRPTASSRDFISSVLDTAKNMITEQIRPAVEIERLIRGLNSWPSAYTYLEGKTCKIWEAKAVEETSDKEPGTILNVTKDTFAVSTGQGILQVSTIQMEGKKRMTVRDFLLGHAIKTGSILGEKTN